MPIFLNMYASDYTNLFEEIKMLYLYSCWIFQNDSGYLGYFSTYFMYQSFVMFIVLIKCIWFSLKMWFSPTVNFPEGQLFGCLSHEWFVVCSWLVQSSYCLCISSVWFVAQWDHNQPLWFTGNSVICCWYSCFVTGRCCFGVWDSVALWFVEQWPLCHVESGTEPIIDMVQTEGYVEVISC